MTDAILWIADHRRWIYLALAVVAAWQSWRWWRAHRRLRFTRFGLEREAALNARSQALTLTFIVVTLATVVLLLNRFIAPNLTVLFDVPPTPAPPLPTAIPTATATPPLVLPGLQTATAEIVLEPTETRTPLPPAGSGCLNPVATITSPIPGAILAGPVEVRGTANVENFAFYVVQLSTLGENWLTVITSDKVVVGGLLGTWDTRLQQPGEYALRLVVYNSAGIYPEPCTLPITIAAPPASTPAPN